MRQLLRCALASALASVSLAAQSTTAAPCEDAAPLLDSGDRAYCVALAQAVEAAQPQLGILIAGGNPTPGSALLGRRLGGLPRVGVALGVNAVGVRIPDVERASTAPTDEIALPAPAISGSLAVGLLPGLSVSPTIGGVGSLELLGSATWLPFRTLGLDDFDQDAAEFAYGVGGRLGLLRESFVVPAVGISVMYRRLQRIRYGDVCPREAGVDLLAVQRDSYRVRGGVCALPGDPGEFAFDLTSWSGRATVGKRLLGLGLVAGAGYDRFDSDVEFGLATNVELPVIGTQPVFVRASELEVESDRWSVFGGASYSFLLTSLVAEVGWMEGGDGLPAFNTALSDFDPGSGTWYGSLGLRFGP